MASPIILRALVLWSVIIGATQAASDVLDLSMKDFASTVGTESLMLAEFFAPWCGHCKALAPEYEKAATALKPEVKLAKVDCTVETELCAQHDVKGYPTLKVFRSGVPTDYGGTRKADGIISYMRKQAMPAITEVTASNHLSFQSTDKIVVIAYLGASDSTINATFTKVADIFRDNYVFGATGDAEAIKQAGVSTPAIVLYKAFDEKRNDLADITQLTEETLQSFIKTNSVPLIDEIGPENANTYYQSNVPLAYLFVENDEQRQALIPVIEPFAKKYKGKINFVHIDAVRFASHAERLNLKPTWPAFVIHATDGGAKYPLKQSLDITTANIEPFLADFVEGKIKPDAKSDPIPTSQNGPVHILVHDEFEKVVYENDRDVFVEFYAPWCGYCKRLAPTWDDLGAKLSSLRDILTIAKMDATSNDVPVESHIEIAGFPTILLFKKGDKRTPVTYEGDRSLQSLLEFLAQEGVATQGKDVIQIASEAAGHTPSDAEKAEAAADAEGDEDDLAEEEEDVEDDDEADEVEDKARDTVRQEIKAHEGHDEL